jgi:hypothetical protein
MADNPFAQKHRGLLAALGVEPLAPRAEDPAIRALVDMLMGKPTPANNLNPYASTLGDVFGTLAPSTLTNPPSNALASFTTRSSPVFPPPSSPTHPFGSLADLIAPPAPQRINALYAPPKPKPIAPETKRKAFFSFQFDDIMRVNNVRNAWKITHPHSSLNRSFYDSSLWETRKLLSPEGIKNLIRVGVLRTSAVCVLAGSMTWNRRWVRYEIARAVIDGRGLLTVHINSINHHLTKGPHPLGRNPLAHMGVAKLQPNKIGPPRYFLYEMDLVPDGTGRVTEQWSPYGDYTLPVKKPTWLGDPPIDHVRRLSADAAEYDYELDNGHRNIGSWIDQAAKKVGR